MWDVITAALVFAGNLLSGRRGSWHYENVTAVFGWTAAITFPLWVVAYTVSPFFPAAQSVADTLFPVWTFCILTALARDGYKVLKPSFDRFIESR